MADTKISGLGAATAMAMANEFMINEAGTSKKLTGTVMSNFFFTRISGATGIAGEYKTFHMLTASVTQTSTSTLATVMTTSALASGIYQFKYNVNYRTSATTEGVDFGINFSGTAGWMVASSWFPSTGGTAATGLADQTGSSTANLVEGKSARALNTKFGTTLGVDTANSDCLMIIEGLIEVTGTGNLILQFCGETGTNITTLRPGTNLELTKIGN